MLKNISSLRSSPIISIAVMLLMCVAIIASSILAGACDSDEVVLSFTGDIIMHRPVRTCAYRNNKTGPAGVSLNNRGFDYLFEATSPLFGDADVTVGNMEFPVYPPFESNNLIFNCRPEIIPAMKKAGFNLLAIANNHLLDQGQEGFNYTLDKLAEYGMPFIGSHRQSHKARAGMVIQVRGMKIGFLACTGVFNYNPPAKNCFINNLYDEKSITQAIDAARPVTDFLVLVAHFGTEYAATPSPGDIAILKRYCDRGVDLVVGHHPHILQGQESYTAADGRRCRIFYSLGNFISNQTWEKVGKSPKGIQVTPQDSIILRCTLTKTAGGVEARYAAIPIFCVNRPIPKGDSFQDRDIRPVIISEEMKNPGSPEGFAFWKSRAAAIVSLLATKAQPVPLTFLTP